MTKKNNIIVTVNSEEFTTKAVVDALTSVASLATLTLNYTEGDYSDTVRQDVMVVRALIGKYSANK